MDENRNTDPDKTAEMPGIGQEKEAEDKAKKTKVRSRGQAQHAIERDLAKAGVEYSPEKLEAALATLYAAYESGGRNPHPCRVCRVLH